MSTIINMIKMMMIIIIIITIIILILIIIITIHYYYELSIGLNLIRDLSPKKGEYSHIIC